MMRRMMLFLETPTTTPKLSRIEVSEGTTERTPDAEYPIEWSQRFLLEGWSPTDEDDDALMSELFGWLKTLPGNLALVDSGWTELLVRKSGRTRLAPGYDDVW